MVFVLDSDGYPLDPCHPARARKLLKHGRAHVVRVYPFTIKLHNRITGESITHGYRLKIDPGSVTTGLAIVADHTHTVVWAAELTHRSKTIHANMQTRAAYRRNRRSRHTRYRPARFLNRRRPQGWLPPSLRSRVDAILSWVTRLRKACPITAISVERVRFDTQLMQDATISGVAYQQGTLAGYEVREYLLERWERRCAYCGVTGVPLQVEHITPRSRGGSDRVSNLTLACEPCNQAKGAQTADEYGYPRIQALAKMPLRDAAAVNATRWALHACLVATGLPVEAGTGGQTKYNRARLGWPKEHWRDAACVGMSTPDDLNLGVEVVLNITAMGRGRYSRTTLTKYGFPRAYLSRQKRVFGFQTGDMAEATVTTGTKKGRYVGRVAVRASGRFDITTDTERVGSIHHRFFRLIQRANGYRYSISPIVQRDLM